jgi:hypothetical protein
VRFDCFLVGGFADRDLRQIGTGGELRHLSLDLDRE